NACAWTQAELLRLGTSHQDECCRSVVYPGGIACCYTPIFAKSGQKFGQLLFRGIGAWMLVFCNDNGFAFLLLSGYRHNLCRKASRLLGSDRLPMTLQRVGILIGTADVIAFCNVLCCFTHAIGMVHGAQFRVNETPAERRVLQMHSAVECRIAFPQ